MFRNKYFLSQSFVALNFTENEPKPKKKKNAIKKKLEKQEIPNMIKFVTFRSECFIDAFA